MITPALQKSVSIKNNLLKRSITTKDPQVKGRYCKKYKDYRKMLSTILKQSKTNYYNHYFETNWKNIKNIWKGLKSILIIKNISADIPKSLTVDSTTVSNLMVISNISTTIFLQLLIKRSVIFHFHINIYQIFLKTDLIFPFL